MVVRRAGVKYADVTIENIWSQFGLAPALKEGKVDAIVTWEPYVTQTLTQVPDLFEVIRGGQHMSYVMVAVAHGPTVEFKPAVIKSIAAGLAQSSYFTRHNPDEAVEIFAKWVPGTDVAIGKKGIRNIHFDPRMSPKVLQAFENPDLLAVDDPLVAVEHGLGAQVGQVGAGVGLAEALAPGDLAREDLRAGRTSSAPPTPTAGWSARRGCHRRSRPAAARRPWRTPR